MLNRKLKIWICLQVVLAAGTILLTAQITFAQEPNHPNVQVLPKPESVYRESSAFHRIDKKYQATGQLLGSGPSATAGSGLNLGYFLDRNEMIQIEYTSNSGQSVSESIDGVKVKTWSFGAHYKKIVSNSFYYKVGIDHRNVEYQRLSKDSFGEAIVNAIFRGLGSVSESKIEFDGNSTNLSIAVGNQWQWENYTMGCDWIGYSQPVVSNISSQRIQNEKTDDQARLQAGQNQYVKNGTATALRFYLGASF